MSKHEHPHQPGQPHNHDHGHDHDHDHSHDHGDHSHSHEGHDHDHSHAHPTSPLTPGPAGDSGALIEDSGTRALSEALRSSFLIVRVIMVVLIIAFFASGVFTVGPQERAVIFRLGKPKSLGPEALLGPGLHWAWPYPFDEVIRIPIGQFQTVRSTSGWFAMTPEQEVMKQDPDPKSSLDPGVDGYTLTADGNILHVRAVARYTVSDPITYAFSFVNASNVVQSALDNAIIHASARFPIDRAWRGDVTAFREAIQKRVVDLVAQHKIGVNVQLAELNVSPPLIVKPSFEEVTSAEIERTKAVNQAQGDANGILGKAKGEAERIVHQGEIDKGYTLQRAETESKILQDRLTEYRRNPHLFEQRALTEAWKNVMTNAQDKIFLPDRADGAPRELRLLLSREPQKPSSTVTNLR